MSSFVLRPEHPPTTERQRRESQSRIFASADWPTQRGLTTSQPNFLQVSPYIEIEHQLDLSSLDPPNRLLALALTQLEPVTSEYAITPYPETFNWSTVFATLRNLAEFENINFPKSEFYVVEFRSQLQEKIDNHRLSKLDKESHREATVSGGLLKYWFGSPDSERRNLATCLWRGKQDAIAGGTGMWHKQARGIISTTYEYIDVRGLRLVVDEGAESWKFETWLFH